ncbi:MAG: family 16 glycoside hydrolase [Chloroflexota bacterium]|nr:family 16 glycoside hydrolase [Chloroflexota bacterium]
MRRDERRSQLGQGLVEYALIILLVGVVVSGTAYTLGPGIGEVYSALNMELTGGQVEPPGPQPTAVGPTPTPTPTPQPADWDEWQVTDGRKWRVEGNSYCAGPGGEHRSFYGAENWTDYEITFKAMLDQGNGYGVYFRATHYEKANAYVFQYDPGYGTGAFLYRQIVNGREKSPFARALAPDDYQWHEVEREVRLRVEGNTFTAYVDGEVVLHARHSEYTHGGVGLRTWDGSDACFQDFQVNFLRPPERGREDLTPVEGIEDERVR